MSSSNESIGQLEILQDHLNMVSSSSEHLCYVHCNFCDTVLIVRAPSNTLFKTVAVRCGHCTNLFSVNMHALLLPTSPPPPSNHLQHLSPTSFFSSPHSLMEEIGNNSSSLLINNNHQAHVFNIDQPIMSNNQTVDHRHEIRKSPSNKRSPEKKQRVPSAYNRFIKEEIQRIKAGNPEISHRKAFSAAAKNWAHFPHIHFGLLPEHQSVMKANVRHQQEGEHNIMMKEGFRASPANVNVRVAPY